MPVSQLKGLFNFDCCNSRDKVLSHAGLVARELMNNWKIISPYGERRFLGLEFYLIIPEVFVDDATHARREQLESGTFYFHTKSKGQWTPPIFNRHGVDITCGNKDCGIYGGILLRHLGGEGHRDGSGVALRSLVRGDQGFKPIKRGSPLGKWSNAEIDFFNRENSSSIFNGPMRVEYDPLIEKIEVTPVARIGLGNKQFAKELLGFRAR